MMNLARNGRTSMAVAKIAGMLGIRVCGDVKAGMITPVHKLVDKPFLESTEETVYTFGDGKCGPKSLRLYNFITGLQKGEIEDPFGWIDIVEL